MRVLLQLAVLLLTCAQSAWPLQTALRRLAAASMIALGTATSTPVSHAVTVPLLPGQSNSFVNSRSVIEGIVSIKDGVPIPSEPTVALYITAKEDIGLWTAGVRNIRTPPLLTKKIAIDSKVIFPLKVSLSEEDLTTEAIAIGQEGFKKLKNGLLISARLDVDGNAATRNERDLLGSGKSDKQDDYYGDFSVLLEGRGVTGKFLTKKQ